MHADRALVHAVRAMVHAVRAMVHADHTDRLPVMCNITISENLAKIVCHLFGVNKFPQEYTYH